MTQRAVAKAIEVQILRLGLTKTEVATRLGFTTVAPLTKRLNGEIALDTTDIENIASALGLDPFDLLDQARFEREQSVAA